MTPPATPKSAFLVPFFGVLPDYFPYWARSCEGNHPHFHWFVYNDHVTAMRPVNPAVTIVPYAPRRMISDFAAVLRLQVPALVRKVCDYRLLFYFLRRDSEPLDDFDFIGYTDMDVVYGRMYRFLEPFLPECVMVGGDDDAPCGPLTLMRRTALPELAASDSLREALTGEPHVSFNESPELLRIFRRIGRVHCVADPLQPAMSQGFNMRKTFAIWKEGSLTVHDWKGNRKEGAFYHFSRGKGKKRFQVRPGAEAPRWAVSKMGIESLHSPASWMRLLLSLLT